MLPFLLLLVLTLISVLLCAATVKRLYGYVRKYRFSESVYTLLFGVIRMRHFVWSYIALVTFNGLVAIYFALHLLPQ